MQRLFSTEKNSKEQSSVDHKGVPKVVKETHHFSVADNAHIDFFFLFFFDYVLGPFFRVRELLLLRCLKILSTIRGEIEFHFPSHPVSFM